MICPRCKLDKDIDSFDGYKSCDACRRRRAQIHRNYINSHQDKMKNYNKEYYHKNKDKMLANYKVYYATTNSRRQYRQKYEKNHKVELQAKRTEKYQNNLNYRLTACLRSRINKAIKGNDKAHRTATLLWCSVDEFKLYLQSRFLDGMTWDNYGNKVNQWSVDHIKPCASFDLSDPEQQKQCFHYTNLQPLWHVDNIKKGAKYERP